MTDVNFEIMKQNTALLILKCRDKKQLKQVLKEQIKWWKEQRL